jgi:GNAT superfamily N-acetyltransferase
MTDAVRIVASTDLAPKELEDFYDEILAPSFDSAELVERAGLLADLADDAAATRGAIAYDEAGLVIGGIVGDWFAESRVMLISYLAARRGQRGHGIGRRLLGEVMPLWTSMFGALLSVAEVENPKFYHDDEDHGDPEARLRFYARLGAKIVAIPYFQPALSAEQPRVRNLFLMVLSADPSVLREDNGVDAATVRCFIEEYVTGSEGPVDDDEVRILRESLHADDVIQLLNPAEFLKGEQP